MENSNPRKMKKEELTKVSDFFNTVMTINKAGLILLILFIPALFILKQLFNFPVPIGFFFTLFILALIVLVYLYLLTRKVTNDIQFRKLAFIYYILVIVVVTLMIPYFGGTDGNGWLIYTFIIIETSMILLLKQGIFMILWIVICYAVLSFSEYFGIIPHYTFFIKKAGEYSYLSSILINLLGTILLGLSFLGFVTRLFSDVYKKTSKELKKERGNLLKTQSQLEGSRDVLEIRIKARTRELEEFSKGLEEQVKQRTEELQDKVQELEKFQRFAVDREIKMVELKEKIKKLEGEKK